MSILLFPHLKAQLEKLEKQMANIEARLKSLEERATASGTVNAIVRDKELERVLLSMQVIRDTYGGHQTWSDDDRKRYKALRTRRDELRQQLGIKY